MIAKRPSSHSLSNNSNGTLNELLELESHYCDFGFPVGHAVTTWEFLSATLPRISSSKLDLRSSKLDEVIRSFAKVFDAERNEIDTSKLLRACRAHLELMRAGGSALCLVAKDLESNLQKVEALYKQSPKECKTLTSLLEMERNSNLHNGNILQDPSAAIGLLWIRRSLSFQSHLFQSLTSSDGLSPKESAYEAYNEHLSPYHGWMLRTVFPASLSQMPHREVFLSKFGEVDVEELDHMMVHKICKKLMALVTTLEPLLMYWKNSFLKLNLEDERRV
jgi:hypothetical protein